MKIGISILLLFLFALYSCKPNRHYSISDDMKAWFAYQQGSYWIYQNDSTKSIDSTSIEIFTHLLNENAHSDYTREMIGMYYKSGFLSSCIIYGYDPCGGNNYYNVSGIRDTLPGAYEVSGPLAYSPNYSPGERIVLPCDDWGIFHYYFLKSDTINQIPYKDLIYSEIITVDSSATNPRLYVRKIYFAKNVGIVKFYELLPYWKINRSYSLLRYKVKQ
jgi:hypothetical protein